MVSLTKKVCKQCKRAKDESEFGEYASQKDGLNNWCRSCASEGHLRRTYGIDLEWYNIMLASQENKCRGCGQTKPNMVVDHDHETGEVRGLLCGNCNMALGGAKDNPETLLNLANHLVEKNRDYFISERYLRLVLQELLDTHPKLRKDILAIGAALEDLKTKLEKE